MAVDRAGNVYVADSGNHTIRKVTPAGVVTTLAGNPSFDQSGNPQGGYADGTGSAARFNLPWGLAVDASGSVYVADTSNHTIRKMTPVGTNWVVTTLAGLAGVYYPYGADGTGSAARFYFPRGMAVDSAGNVYVADSWNHTIRKLTPAGVVTTLAGLAGNSGSVDGTSSAARFYNPFGVAVDTAGIVYVGDSGNDTIRKVTPAGVVTTLAGLAGVSGTNDGTGNAARFHWPFGVAVDSAGNLYVGDSYNDTIRKVTPAGVVTTLAGLAGAYDSVDGTGSAARFNFPHHVAVDSAGNVYVADSSNFTIRKGWPASAGTGVTITSQPQSQTAPAGANLTLSVSATGTLPLHYQWWKENALLPGATTATLNFSSAQLSDSGSYRVVVSDDYHSVSSDSARLTVIADPANNTQPRLPSAPPPGPIQAGQNRLVVITHGWQPRPWYNLLAPFPSSPPNDVPWVDEMVTAIRAQASANWRVDGFKWLSDAWTQLPDEALNKARSLGYRRGRELAAQQWQHVHLIGHSAGAGFVQAAAEAIKGLSPSTVVHTTFLDPYSGEDLWGRGTYGFAADWADCYFAHDIKTDELPVLAGYSPSTTEGPLSHAHNVDVTWLDQGALQLFFDCRGLPQSGPATACRQEAWSSHDWPRQFYAATVSGNAPDGSAGYGFPLSNEGGGWGNHSAYPNNTIAVVLRGTPTLAQRTVPWLASLPMIIEPLAHALSDLGAVLINGAGFLMSSVATGQQRLAGDSAAQQAVVRSAGTNDPVGVPAWLSIGLAVTNAVNFVTFEAAFTSSNAAQGLLTVYWNTNQIGFLDEEVVQPGLQTYRFRLPSTVAGGLHVLGFRLDSFNNTASTVTVTNVATGFVGLSSPVTLAVSRLATNNSTVLTLTGGSGYNYLLQSSSNLTTWTPLATLVNTNGTVAFIDLSATNSTQRFYRAVLP